MVAISPYVWSFFIRRPRAQAQRENLTLGLSSVSILSESLPLQTLLSSVFLVYYVVAIPLLAVLVYRVGKTVTVRRTSGSASSKGGIPRWTIWSNDAHPVRHKTERTSITVLSIHAKEPEEFQLPRFAWQKL